MPRHPPFALRNLKSHEFDRIRTAPPEGGTAKLTSEYARQPHKEATWRLTFVTQRPKTLNLRCSRPLCSSQQTVRTPTPTSNSRLQRRPEETIPHTPKGAGRPVPQDPTACTCPTGRPPPFQPTEAGVLGLNHSDEHLCQCSTHEQPASTFGSIRQPGHSEERQMLLRKEVIQPHLPVRLPCYDLVLITDPTFDGSLHKG